MIGHGSEGAGSLAKIDGHRDAFPVTSPVEKSGRNDWDVYGVGGNVWEWTEEKWDSSYVLRGASWDYGDQYYLRCDRRDGRSATFQRAYVGLRLFLRPLNK